LIVCFWQIGGWCTAGTAPSPYDCESKWIKQTAAGFML
jgi:hypothetical protein